MIEADRNSLGVECLLVDRAGLNPSHNRVAVRHDRKRRSVPEMRAGRGDRDRAPAGRTAGIVQPKLDIVAVTVGDDKATVWQRGNLYLLEVVPKDGHGS